MSYRFWEAPEPGEMTYDMYRHDLTVMARRSQLREGQLAYNNLAALRPELARGINGTDLDPFYNDNRLTEFFAHVEAHWDDGRSDAGRGRAAHPGRGIAAAPGAGPEGEGPQGDAQ